MSTHNVHVDYRIGGASRLLLVSVALIFDALPVLIMVMAAALMLILVGSSCIDAATASWFSAGKYVSGAMCAVSGGVALGAGWSLLFIGPALYYGLQWVVMMFALLTFWLWLRVMYSYNMWDLKGNKLVANVLGILLEAIPIIGLLPGITLMVIRHIFISRAEDTVHALKEAAKARLGMQQEDGTRRTMPRRGSTRRTMPRRTTGPIQSGERSYPQSASQQSAKRGYNTVVPQQTQVTGAKPVRGAHDTTVLPIQQTA